MQFWKPVGVKFVLLLLLSVLVACGGNKVAEYEKYVYVPVDVDNADAETLQQIPGIEAKLAESLISARPYGSNETFLAKLAESLTTEQVAAAATYLVAP